MDRLNYIRRKAPFFQQFATWREVTLYLGTVTSEDRDRVLQPILSAHVSDQDHRWRTILLVLFWPGLLWIWSKTSSLARDPDELWQEVYWAFHQSISRLDPTRRPERLGQKVINDTLHRVRESYRRQRRCADCEIQPDPGLIETTAALRGREMEEADLLRELTRYLKHGVISQSEFFGAIGTNLYGRTDAEFASQVGITPAAAKKRRQRAEAAMQRFERRLE